MGADLAARADVRGAGEDDAGAIVVSSPISTSASTRVLVGCRKVTPARAWARRMRAWATLSASIRPARSLTPSARVRVGDQVRGDPLAPLAQDRDRARQVALALHQVDLIERVDQRPASKAYVPRLTSRTRSSSAVASSGRLVSTMRSTPPSSRAHDTAVAGGVELVGRQQGRRRLFALVRGQQSCEVVGADQRLVAGEDHERAGRVREPRACGEDGGAGALPLALLDHLDAVWDPSATPSPGRVTHSTRVAPAARAASTTHASMGLPHTGWSTLGSDERIRVPRPAAMIRTVNPSAMGRSG